MRIPRLGLATFLTLLASTVTSSASSGAFTEREVTFKNGAVELKGTVMVPSASGHHPAVVFLHGSGPSTRDGARPYAEEFAKLGFASVFFDKRGCGSSGGSWTTSSLDDLAGDALSAVKLLQQQKEVDGARVGLWGVSQAGWVATLAAAQSNQVAFMVVITGGGASPRETELYSYRRAFEHARLSEAEMSEAFAVIDMYFDYLATGAGRDDVVARLEKAANSKWYPHARLDRILPSQENRKNWSWVASWDPAASIAAIECPVLLMFGDADANVPTDVAVKKWREGLSAAGNDDVSIVVFPGAGHGIRLGEHSQSSGEPFADGYAEVMLGWLWYHVLTHR